MDSKNEISKRFREVFLSGTWIANTNYKKLLSEISWEEAITKVEGMNTIAILTLHINYYIAGVLNVFENGALEISDKHSFTFPEITSKKEWKDVVGKLSRNSESLAKYIEQMSKNQLDQIFIDEKYGSYYRNIEGMIEHGYYHLGQISLLKKMIKEPIN